MLMDVLVAFLFCCGIMANEVITLENYYKIADLIVQAELHGYVAKQAEKYLCEPCEKPDIVITKEEIDAVVEQRKREIEFVGLTDEDHEYVASGALYYMKLLPFGGFRLHSSAVVVDNKAYLFSADSGTGKSTHTSLWLKNFGNRAYILNDDKPALRCLNGIWYAYGTPWSGKNDISVNKRVPLCGIAVLERGKENSIVRLSTDDAVMHLLLQISHFRKGDNLDKLFGMFEQLVSQVPIWILRCNMDPAAAIVAYEAMSKECISVNFAQ